MVVLAAGGGGGECVVTDEGSPVDNLGGAIDGGGRWVETDDVGVALEGGQLIDEVFSLG